MSITHALRRLSVGITTALLLAASPQAWAHDDATLGTLPAPNGGQVRAAGIYHFELVVAPPAPAAKSAPLWVYVTDHAGAKTPTAGATGTATLLVSGNKTVIALKPDAGNRLKGDGVYGSAPDMKVLVAITWPGKPAEQARFTPLADKPGAARKGAATKP